MLTKIMDKFDEQFILNFWATENYTGNVDELEFSNWQKRQTQKAILHKEEVKRFIESTIREVLESVQEIELAPDKKTLKLLAELDNKSEAFGFGQGWVCNKLDKNIKKILN